MATHQQPWLKSYPQGISPQINVTEFSSIVDVFEKSVRKFSGRPAFTNLDHTLSFKDLDDQSRAFAAFLQKKLGLKKGDRIAIQMPNLLQYPVALFGALRAGLIVVNTNPLYTPREMEHQFKDSGARAVVILANFCHSLEEVLKTHKMEHVIITEIADLLPFPKRSLVNFVVKNVKKMVPKYNIPGAISFRSALAEGEALTLSRPEIGLDDTAFLQYTGGTTGVAKGAQLLHRNIVANLCQTSAWMAVRFQEGNETVITALPMYHIFSLTINCMLFMRYGGHNILITNPKDIPGFVKEMAKHPFTVFTGVNTLFNALMNNEEFKKLNFSPLKLSVGGGMAVQSAVAKRWYELTGTYLVQGYGLSETSPVLTCNPIDGTHRDGTIGVPVPNTEISIQDDQNTILPLGKEGEICGKGPQVMPGYWNRADETDKVMIDGWFHTGDIGVMGEDGYITIVDRKKDMILVSGFNVYPNEIEDVVATHPSVLEVAAIGVPDEKSGEVPKIFVVKRNDSLTTDELKAFCKEKLTGYKVPKYIEFKKELPKTNVGKILRRALRDEELKQTKH